MLLFYYSGVRFATIGHGLHPSVPVVTIDTSSKGNIMSTATTNVTIYSAPWCAFCKTEKQYLDHLGVSYTVKDIEEDEGVMEELIAKSGQRSVPVTDIDGVLIRGFDRAKIDLTLKEKQLI